MREPCRYRCRYCGAILPAWLPVAKCPDKLDEHELSVRRGRPALVDWLALSDEQADRTPAAPDPDEDKHGQDLLYARGELSRLVRC